MKKQEVFLIGLVAVLFLLPFPVNGQNKEKNDKSNIYPEHIRPYSKNPFYWQFGQQPVFLIGGSDQDNLFQLPDIEEQLDLLASVGGNYVRCTMSSRDGGDLKPYAKKDGWYDLDKWNSRYWNKLDEFFSMTAERGIIPQVEIWATYDFYQGPQGWEQNVFNPVNNVNYNAKKSDLPSKIDYRAQMKVNPFFESVPALSNNERVLEYQQRFVDKILSIAFKYDHILYCIDNETNARPEWGRYWARYIRKKAEEAGQRIYITEMWDNWDITDGQVEGVRRQNDESHPFLDRSKVANTLNAPEIYDFVDVANNNAQKGDAHYLAGVFMRNWIKNSGKIRPINNVKVYGGTIYEEWTKGWAGSFKDGEERFWRNLFAGHASTRFHRPPYGLGLNAVAQKHIQSMRMLTDSMDLFNHVPANELLSQRGENEAYCLAFPDREYALYFPGRGNVKLDLPSGTYKMRWLHIRSSSWRNPVQVDDPEIIKTPDADQWVLWIKNLKKLL